MISGVAQGNSGFAGKVMQRVGRLAGQVEKVAAKMEDGGNAGQARKADRLMRAMGDGAVLSHPKFGGNSMVYTAIGVGDSVNFGQAMKRVITGVAGPVEQPEGPATEEPVGEVPVEGGTGGVPTTGEAGAGGGTTGTVVDVVG